MARRRRNQLTPWMPPPDQMGGFGQPAYQQPAMPGLDLMDPFRGMQQPDEGGDDWGGGRQAVSEPELPPGELKSLLGKGMSALGYLSESIGKGGYAVRALASGDPGGAALNLIPFYDTIRENLAPGLPEAPKISGEELLSDKWGVMDKPEGWFTSPGDFGRKMAGLGTELVDPLMLLGTGGLTAKGAAKMIGTEAVATDLAKIGEQTISRLAGKGKVGTIMGRTPAARATEIAAGERALAGAYLPFSQKPLFGMTTNLGLAPEAAAKVYGAAYSNPLSVAMRGMFGHQGSGGKYTAEAQRLADLRYSEAMRMTEIMDDVSPVLGRNMDDLLKTAQEAATHAGAASDPISEQAFQNWGRSLVEAPGGIPEPNAILTSLREKLGMAAGAPIGKSLEHTDQIGKDFYNVFDVMKRTQDDALARIQTLGGTVKDLDDAFVEHYFRGATNAVQTQAKATLAGADQEAKFWMQRNWRDIPGGSAAVNDMVMDPLVIRARTLPDALPADVSGKLAAGAVVKAADRANFGRVLNVGKDTSTVFFRSPEGIEAVVDLPNMLLTPTGKAVPKLLEATPRAANIPAAEYRTLLEKALMAKGKMPVAGGSIEKLQEQYLMEMHIKPRLQPALDASLAAKKITPEQYAEQLEEWSKPIVSAIGEMGTEKAAPTRAAELVASINRLPKSVVQTGLYDKSLVKDWHSYMKSAINMESNLRTMHNFISDAKVVKSAQAGAAADKLLSEGYKPLSKVWKNSGYGQEGLGTFVLERQPELRTQYERLQQLAKSVAAPEADRKAAANAANKLVSDAVDALHISPQAVNALKAYKAVLSPKIENTLTESIDKVSNLFKGYLITGPATHIRNFLSDFWNAIGEGNLNPFKAASNRVRAIKMLTGKGELPELAKEGELLGIFTSGHVFDVTGGGAGSTLPRGMTGGVAEAMAGGSWNPLSPNNKLVRSNAQVMQFTDSVGRLADWLTMREAGMSPSQAKYYLLKTHYAHAGSKMAPFEKNVANRAMLFYGWMRFNMPLQLQRLIQRPGGITGQAVRLMGKGQVQAEGEGYTPKFLREGMALNVGGPPEATSFVRASGLPIEDLNKFMFSGGLPKVGRTMEKFVAGMHPAITAPIEMFANKQLYSGRKISDLESTTKALGAPEMPFVDRLTHYSPWSRQIGDYLSLIDKRKTLGQKALNYGTGVKIGTYNVPKLEQMDYRNIIEEQLAADPLVREMSIYNVPKSKRGTPAAVESQKTIRRLGGIAKHLSKLKKQQEMAEAGR